MQQPRGVAQAGAVISPAVPADSNIMAQRIKAAVAALDIIATFKAVALLSLCGGFVLSVMGRDASQLLGITITTVTALAAFLQPGAAARRASDAEQPERLTGGGYDNGGDR